MNSIKTVYKIRKIHIRFSKRPPQSCLQSSVRVTIFWNTFLRVTFEILSFSSSIRCFTWFRLLGSTLKTLSLRWPHKKKNCWRQIRRPWRPQWLSDQTITKKFMKECHRVLHYMGCCTVSLQITISFMNLWLGDELFNDVTICSWINCRRETDWSNNSWATNCSPHYNFLGCSRVSQNLWGLVSCQIRQFRALTYADKWNQASSV